MKARIIGGLAGAFALAACGGSPSSSVQAAGCPEFALPAPPVLMYPLSGSAAIPDGNFTLVESHQYGTSMQIKASAGIAFSASAPNAAVPSPLPSPNATAPPNSSPVGYAVPALAPATAFSVVGHFDDGPGCQTDITVGTFTTQ